MTRWQHIFLAVKLLPHLLFRREVRAMLWQMRQFCGALPTILHPPLSQALAQLEQEEAHFPASIGEERMRDLADLAALLAIRSPLGLCLRRSLTRYHFLRGMGVPVQVHFGARLVGDKADRDVTGHAWLVRNGRPYYEAEENWRDFTVILRWPHAGDTPVAAEPQSH